MGVQKVLAGPDGHGMRGVKLVQGCGPGRGKESQAGERHWNWGRDKASSPP